MNLKTISQTKGWYLGKISGRINLSKKIMITSSKMIRKYHFNPGNYIRIVSLKEPRAREDFIVLPYIKNIFKNYEYFNEILERIKRVDNPERVNDNYNKDLQEIAKYFNTLAEKMEFLPFKDLLFDLMGEKSNKESINIGLPDFWLINNNLHIGETVLLRNDIPSQIFY